MVLRTPQFPTLTALRAGPPLFTAGKFRFPDLLPLFFLRISSRRPPGAKRGILQIENGKETCNDYSTLPRKIMTLSLKRLFEKLFDFFLPQNELAKRLEAMPIEELSKLAAPRRFTQAGIDCFAIFRYEDPLIRQAILEVKYRGNKTIAAKLAAVCGYALFEELSEKIVFGEFNKPLLLPVPLSKNRKRERGFNQTELLASLLPPEIKNAVSFAADALIKIKDTKTQVFLKRGNRRKNIAGAFKVSNPAAVAGRNTVVFDDVITTGATSVEIARTLRAAGAKKILCFAVAY